MNNVLITGITGSLGRALCEHLQKDNNYNIFGIYNSEQKYSHLKRNLNLQSINCTKSNIADPDFIKTINYILSYYKIDYVIHSAAMKHVDICEDNPTEAVKTNILASDIIVKQCLLHNIKNLIALSTDKSIEPCNIYGYSKLIMQNIVLNNGYSVYQGANFLWSDGSVLNIWMDQMTKGKPLTVTNPSHQRYFNTLGYVAELIIKNIDAKNKILLPEYVYKVKLQDLLDAFMEHFNYHNHIIIGADPMEKDIEVIEKSITNRIDADKETIKSWLKSYND